MILLQDYKDRVFWVDFNINDVDTERIKEVGYEIKDEIQDVKDKSAYVSDYDDELYFTTCEYQGCNKWIAMDYDGNAPEYCNEHENDN